jgi:hypothetical protein
MFYEFRQNNSGGGFTIDEDRGLSVMVVVEADDLADANDRARRIGLYFNGCDTGRDCPCCGDRWYEVWNDRDASEVPAYHGTPIEEVVTDNMINWADDQPAVYVHFKDGTRVGYRQVGARFEKAMA